MRLESGRDTNHVDHVYCACACACMHEHACKDICNVLAILGACVRVSLPE